MKLEEIVATLTELAPPAGAAEWDNVGLLAGDPDARTARCLLTIDLTAAVLAEARRAGADLIIAYHPPVWDPLKRVVAGSGPSPLLYELIRAGIAVYALHTALDTAPGGVNDALAELLGIRDARPLQPDQPASGKMCKIVAFVPPADLERVSAALFAAGAGHIGPAGKYDQCSFRMPGTGTFRCGPKSNPTIGRPGRSEQVEEVRLETIVPAPDVPAVTAALCAAHSYEEPAYDVYPLLTPAAGLGLGRIGELPAPTSAAELIDRIKTRLKLAAVGVIAPTRRAVRRAAVGAGSCGGLFRAVIDQGGDFYLTGELSHHNALKLSEAGVTTVCVGHSNSERLVLPRVARHLRRAHRGLQVQLSRRDRDPVTWG